MDVSTAEHKVAHTSPTHITATDIPTLLNQPQYANLQVLSLDCFDTLLWRKTATPKDVFYDLQQRPLFKSLGVTAYQRMASAGRAYRENFITKNKNQVSIHDIYEHHTALSDEQKRSLAEEELQAEIETCYAFPPFLELIQDAKSRGLKVIIVSDIYYSEAQLRKLLSSHLPADVMKCIDHIFCSIDHGKSKSEGLFHDVLASLSIPAEQCLHIGDHLTADFEAPTRLRMQALHFSQFNETVTDVLRLQHSAASLKQLADMDTQAQKQARLSPFRGVFSLKNPVPNTPESIIGYLTFGPMLYAFSAFIENELAELKAAGKTIRPLFLLRDAYLLYRGCAAYAGHTVGELAHIRKFVAVAASFRTQADIDDYMSRIQPYYYNFWVICEQLGLPIEVTKAIIQTANASPTPTATFNALIHDEGMMQLIFKRSAEARENLKKYLQNHLHIKQGDTVVLIDTGYHGVTQTHLTRALGEELGIEIVGRYFIASHEPDRPDCESLLTSTWCEHGLFEQCCTYKEGAVTGYDTQGNPQYEALKLSDAQYTKVDAVQNEALNFIHDAKRYFTSLNAPFPLAVLKNAAEACLYRQIFFPTPDEVLFFNDFQHDKDMGPDQRKTIYHIPQANDHLRQTHTPFGIHPYAERAINIELSLSSLMKRTFDLAFKPEEKSYYRESISVVSLMGDDYEKMDCQAVPTKDGYYTFSFNSVPNVYLALAFGEHYEWVEINSLTRSDQPNHNLITTPALLTLNQMEAHRSLFQCLSQQAYLMLNPVQTQATLVTYQLTFRPILRWNKP